MRRSPTYIHLRVQWHLLGPDSPGQRFERARFHDLLMTLNKDPAIGDYDDFSYRPDRCQLAKMRPPHPQGGQAFSKVVYEDDQLTVVEEWAELSADEFERKFKGILAAWFRHFPETIAVVERCWLRALEQSQHSHDAREFLGDRVLRLKEHLANSFADMPHQVGFTVGCVRKLGAQQLVLDTRVASWRDGKSVWIEVGGTLPLAPPINPTNTEEARRPFAACKSFLEQEVIGLLRKFDTPEEGQTP